MGLTPRHAARAWARIAADLTAGPRARGAQPVTISRDCDASEAPFSPESTDDAIELWRAFVAGHWSLIDHFDSDGQRYLVARRNGSVTRDATAGVTLREQQVLAYRASGHALKVVAYELCLSQASASRDLASGMKKLGIRSQVELARVFGAQATPSTCADRSWRSD